MSFNVNNSLYEAFEQLDELHEDAAEQKQASKDFWAKAKQKEVDEVAFHKAFDDELRALDLMGIFDADGRLLDRSVYAQIKQAKEQHPDSWAVKAASKLWALIYVDNRYYQMGKATREAEAVAQAAEWERKRVELEAEKKRKEQVEFDRRSTLAAELTATVVPAAIKMIDNGLIQQLESYTNKKIKNCIIVPKKVDSYQGTTYPFVICLSKDGSGYLLTEQNAEDVDTVANNIRNLIKNEVKDARNAEAKAIDVLRKNKGGACILLGNSGTLYFINYTNYYGTSEDRFRDSYLTVSTKDFYEEKLPDVHYLNDIPEPFKVIYTSVGENDGNQRTYRNSYSRAWKSWDSSKAHLISKYIPKEAGLHHGTWSETHVSFDEKPWSEKHSTMDNIDTWATVSRTDYSTD